MVSGLLCPTESPYSDSVSLRLRSIKNLSLQDIITRWSIMQKVRRQPFIPEGMHRPPTACRFIISGSISLPSRGSFQLSLTVLVHFRSDRVFRLSPWSGQIPARFPVPGSTWDASRLLRNFVYTALTFFGVFFQTLQLSPCNATLRSRPCAPSG